MDGEPRGHRRGGARGRRASMRAAYGGGVRRSFVSLLQRRPERRRDAGDRLAASLFLEGEPVPVVLAYDTRRREALSWTSAPGRRGEEGTVAMRPDHRVAITQR